MGTPDFAVPCLKALCDAGHEIAAVFTQPDKPQGRKMIMVAPPVKEYATEHNIPVYQPERVKDGKAFQILKELNPELIAVVAYGKILPKDILSLPKYGCVNVHASLLPRHRGASPIQWCIVCGDKKTGVCTMKMDEGMDTGDILLCEQTPIFPTETGEELFERLSGMGAELLVKTVSGLENGDITPTPQSDEGVSYAPIIKREMGLLDFTKPAQEIYNLIRGFYSWPSTYFIYNNKRYKVYSAKTVENCKGKPGEVIKSSGELIIACGDGNGISVLNLQPEGKKSMSVTEFLAGNGFEKGTVICE